MTPPPNDPRRPQQPPFPAGRIHTPGVLTRPPKPANPKRRITATRVLVVAAMLTVVARLTAVQLVEGPSLQHQATGQRTETATLTAERGQILDRDGQPFAVDVHGDDVYADPTLVTDPTSLAGTLSPILSRPQATLYDELTRKNTRFVYLARGVDLATGRKVSALNLSGIGELPTTKRIYPAGSAGAAVVGFTNRDELGLGGYEASLNDTLTGKNGSTSLEVDPLGRQIPLADAELSPAVPGRSVELTLDRDMTYAAQTALNQQVKESHAAGGVAIIMDVHTGQILALAASPTFDPNNLAAADPNALGNRAFGQVYEPGSVNKAVTASAALEEGIANPDTIVQEQAALTIGGHTFTDDEPLSGPYTLTGVIAKSSNIGTIKVAEQLGSQRLYQYMRKFGYGQLSGVGFPGESPGILTNPSSWSASQRANTAIGYGVSVTPIQMASVYATIANGGVRVTPSLIKAVQGADGVMHPVAPPAQERVISAKTAAEVTQMLEAVTQEGGTGTNADIPGYVVAGKTGTARKVNLACHCYNGGYYASFAGFAPADKPELVGMVMMDDPKGAHYGNLVSAPVFQQMMTFALQSMDIPPTGALPPRLKLRP